MQPHCSSQDILKLSKLLEICHFISLKMKSSVSAPNTFEDFSVTHSSHSSSWLLLSLLPNIPLRVSRACHSLSRALPGTSNSLLSCPLEHCFHNAVPCSSFWCYLGGIVWWEKVQWKEHNNSNFNRKHKIPWNIFRHHCPGYLWQFPSIENFSLSSALF